MKGGRPNDEWTPAPSILRPLGALGRLFCATPRAKAPRAGKGRLGTLEKPPPPRAVAHSALHASGVASFGDVRGWFE